MNENPWVCNLYARHAALTSGNVQLSLVNTAGILW